MTLTEFRKLYGIKRIDFDKIEPTGLDTQYDSDRLVCPYCEAKIDYDSEEIDSILKGEPYRCPACEKWFYAEGEISVDTSCYPMADKVLEHKRYIVSIYDHLDKCEKVGVDFDTNRYGNVEWETYYKYAKSLLENGEME